jgi:hypothetical protein
MYYHSFIYAQSGWVFILMYTFIDKYRPLVGNHGYACCSTCSRQAHKVLAADITGKQGSSHLYRENMSSDDIGK